VERRKGRKGRKVKVVSPCDGCPGIDKFSFFGCAKACEKFLGNLKVVAEKKESPCLNFRCGVPGANSEDRERCENCPIRQAYSQSLGKSGDRTKCVLGKKEPNHYFSKRELGGSRYFRR